MCRRSLIGNVVIGALLCVWSAQGYAADITIDNFEEGLADMTVNTNTQTATDVDTNLDVNNVIGERRDSSVTWTSGSEDVVLRINYGTSGTLNYSSGSPANGRFDLVYGNGGFLSADLTDGGSITNTCFGLLFDDADYEGDILFTVLTGETNSGTASAKTPTLIPEGEDEWVYINFSAFSNYLNLDFTDVDKIEIEIDGPSKADYTITQILSTVPEPSVLALLGFGGLAFLISVRRRFRKS